MSVTTPVIRLFFAGGFLLVVILLFVAYGIYTKPHRSVKDEEAISVTADDLFDQFQQDETTANGKYLDRVLEVTGKISEVSVNLDEKPVLMLQTSDPMFGVRCTMEDSSLEDQPGAVVTIRGICTGYLSDVVITNGILVK